MKQSRNDLNKIAVERIVVERRVSDGETSELSNAIVDLSVRVAPIHHFADEPRLFQGRIQTWVVLAKISDKIANATAEDFGGVALENEEKRRINSGAVDGAVRVLVVSGKMTQKREGVTATR